MKLVIVILLLCATTLKLKLILAVASSAEIFEPPTNQYILEGGIATLTCRIQGATTAYWSINGIPTNYPKDQSYYEGLGVVFNNSNNVNLTMTTPAWLSAKVNNIVCIAADENRRHVNSDMARIYVFKTFRPDPPLVSLEVIYNSTLLPQLNATIVGRPLWQGYEISEFKVNITNTSSDFLLDQIIVPVSNFENYTIQVQVDGSLFENATHHCYTVSIFASAVSPLYNGESKSTKVTTAMLRTPGDFSEANGVNPIVLYNSDGTLVYVSLQIQLPDVCIYQNISYTIMAEELGNNNETIEVLTGGPYGHLGSGVVSQRIGGPGLKEGRRYSVRVKVDSITGTSESSKYIYSTKKDFCSRESCTNIPLTPSDDVSLYKVAMGISFGIASMLLLAFSVLLVCFCVHHSRTQQRGGYSTLTPACSINRTMVTNPIYDSGQVYDSIDPQFDRAHPQTIPKYSFSPSHNKSSSNSIQFTREAMQLTPPTCAEVSVPVCNAYSIPGEVVSNNSRSTNGPNAAPHLPPMNSMALKKSRKDQRKLHVPLPGVPSSCHDGPLDVFKLESYQDSVKSEESQYVEMSQTGTLSRQGIQPEHDM